MTQEHPAAEPPRAPRRSERLRQCAVWMYFGEEITQSAIEILQAPVELPQSLGVLADGLAGIGQRAERQRRECGLRDRSLRRHITQCHSAARTR